MIHEKLGGRPTDGGQQQLEVLVGPRACTILEQGK